MPDLNRPLDASIKTAASEIDTLDRGQKKSNKKNRPKSKINAKSALVVVVAVSVFIQMDELSRWLFGLPDEAVKSDIVELLEHTDQKLQDGFQHTGRYPETLPASTPTWLVGYKRNLAGYQLSAKINDVSASLERQGSSVTID
ncbi:MAG: hypothetical protein P8N51_05755 [Pseudomonadales bacterium]|nr:hypothetical protein [Pseudomonadales bacterium]MDG1441346.1 hypothetical protein [Pseudomonadales bacterium]